MTASGNNGGKKTKSEVLAVALAAIVIAAGICVVMFNVPQDSAQKDNIIGDWYCAVSERYTMAGGYVVDEYSEGDDPMLKIYKFNDGMIFGQLDNKEFTGTMTAEGHMKIVDIMGDDYSITLEGEYGDNGADDGILYLTSATFIESARSTTHYASQYYVVVKDISRIPDINKSADLDFALGNWTFEPDASAFLTEDGEDTTRTLSVTIDKVNGHLMKATARTFVEGSDVIEDAVVLSVMHYGDDRNSYKGVMLYNKTTFCQIMFDGSEGGGYTMHAHLGSYADPTTPDNTMSSACYYFVKDGGTAHGEKYDFNLGGREYRATSIKSMNKFGEITTVSTDLVISFSKIDRFNVCFTAICDNNVYLCKYAGYLHMSDDGRYLGEYCIRDYNTSGTAFGSVGVACLSFNDDLTEMTASAQQYVDSDWVSQTIVWHLIN